MSWKEDPIALMEVEIIEKVITERLRKGMTELEFAKNANLSINAVRSLESGMGFNLPTLLKIFDVLELELVITKK